MTKKDTRQLFPLKKKVAHTAHGHFICLYCGELKEFSNEKIQGVIKKIGMENDFEADMFSIQVFGYCNNCQEKIKENEK